MIITVLIFGSGPTFLTDKNYSFQANVSLKVTVVFLKTYGTYFTGSEEIGVLVYFFRNQPSD